MSSGSLKVEPVGRRPLEQSQLDAKDVFILDTGNGDVFVWIGRQATPQEKRESMKKADAYLSEHKRPAWTHVERVAQVGNVAFSNCQMCKSNCFVQGAEPAPFTQYFRTWQGYGETRSRIARSPSQPRLFHALLRPGSANFWVAELYNFDQDELNTDDVMFLDVPESNTVYLWVGEGADADEKRLGPELVKVSSSSRF